jgi:Flp pilus assembly protein TadD
VARLRLGGLAFVVLAVLAGAMMVPGIASTDLGRDSADLVAAGRAGEAADYAQAAVTAEPWSASAYAQLAIAEQGRDRLPDARDAAQQAVELAPQDALKQTLLGVVDHRLGLDRAAVGRLRAAARLSSGDPKKVTVATIRRAFRLARAQELAP